MNTRKRKVKRKPVITKRQWMWENCYKQAELLRENPETVIEKDIWNLKWILYTINKDSRWYRMGMVRTLRRTIKLLEARKKD